MKHHPIYVAVAGFLMGIAEVIPGVSGGTIAFITGIYEKLLNTIKSVGPELFRTLKSDGIKGAWIHINGGFLLALGTGMLIGVGFALKIITHLIHEEPEILWAFFFGLIIASAMYIGRQITRWRSLEIGLLIVGAVVACALTLLSPVESSGNLVIVFFGATIAICALILPGISGSFMLLIMGLYTLVIPSVKAVLLDQDFSRFPIVATFAAGAVIGLLTFSHVVSWTFKNYRNPTLALLTGFMIGSLNKIWPWRIPTKGLDEDYNVTTDPALMDKVISDYNVMPANYTGDPKLMLCLVMMVAGLVAVLGLSWFGARAEPAEKTGSERPIDGI